MTGYGADSLKKVIVVAPHFPPSGLAGVHRSRLFAQHLPEFGWEPIIVSVKPEQYEEHPDANLLKLLPHGLRVEHVGAIPIRPVRFVGDVGIRGFVPMLRRILRIIDREPVDFLYIPIPSFYAALLGPLVKRMRGVPYGIDYIDPWVYTPTGRENLKAKVSLGVARLLEPAAVGGASLITGVAERYYLPVLERNPELHRQAVIAAMPYGGEPADHQRLKTLGIEPYLFRGGPARFRMVYAGALLPRAFEPLERMCAAIARDRDLFADVEIYFIGTGTSPDDGKGYNVKAAAERHGLWETVIREHPARIPYLDTLAHLEASDAVFVLGSTEPHYTPSKVFQGILSGKPVFAVLHSASTACAILRETNAGIVLDFDGEADVARIESSFAEAFRRFRTFAAAYEPGQVDMAAFEPYTARRVTAILAAALDEAYSRSHA